MTTIVFLVRHASHDRLNKVLCGRTSDVSLNAFGRGEAQRVAERLRGERIAAVLSSPLARARETAAIIAGDRGLKVQASELLDEIDLGSWSGKTFSELADDPAWLAWNGQRDVARPPGGESMQDVQYRLRLWMDDAQARFANTSIVAVSHGDVIKALLADSLGLSVAQHDRFEIGPASISVLLAGDWGRKVHSINEAPR